MRNLLPATFEWLSREAGHRARRGRRAAPSAELMEGRRPLSSAGLGLVQLPPPPSQVSTGSSMLGQPDIAILTPPEDDTTNTARDNLSYAANGGFLQWPLKLPSPVAMTRLN